MRAHEEGVGAGLEGVAVGGVEADEAAEGGPAVVVAVFQADEDVCGVLDARREERFVNIRRSIRVFMSRSFREPCFIGFKSLSERA